MANERKARRADRLDPPGPTAEAVAVEAAATCGRIELKSTRGKRLTAAKFYVEGSLGRAQYLVGVQYQTLLGLNR
jgi:hypothetical protein